MVSLLKAKAQKLVFHGFPSEGKGTKMTFMVSPLKAKAQKLVFHVFPSEGKGTKNDFS
jgi:hypothetical protein